MTFNYQRYYELAAADDIETFRSVLLKVGDEYGFPLVNVTVSRTLPNGQVQERAVRNDPPKWEQRVLDASASARDPCLRIARESNRPFAYDQSLYANDGAGDLWEDQAPFGFRTGIAAVLHVEPRRRRFIIGMDRHEALPGDTNRLMRMLADLQLMAAFVQDTAFRVLMPEEGQGELTALTCRERDVLAWASQGKTAWETGMLLSISEHTVNKHLASAARRLGCTSKAQSIARAIERGLL